MSSIPCRACWRAKPSVRCTWFRVRIGAPEGAAIVAGSVRSTLEARSLAGSERWLTHSIAPLLREGDLLNFVDVAPWFKSLTGSAEVIEQFSTENAAEVDLFAMDLSPGVALVGTSYSETPCFTSKGLSNLPWVAMS
ncbi:MAG: hypothetical protein ACI8Z1_002474 [Candidatus Azotimanducaceae bacterium]|jgi:hypothetical protein